MNAAVLEAVAAHLRDGGRHIAVGERPASVTGALPFAVVYMNTSTFEDDDVRSVDRAGDHLVQVQVWGSTYESAGLLAAALDDRMAEPGIDPDGHAVLLVKRDSQFGPARDDDTHPEPSRWRIDLLYRIWTEPAPETS